MLINYVEAASTLHSNRWKCNDSFADCRGCNSSAAIPLAKSHCRGPRRICNSPNGFTADSSRLLPTRVLGSSVTGRTILRPNRPLVFTWRGAALAASVVALPLVVLSSKAAFDAVDPSLRDVARTLGRSELSIFLSITLPLGWRGVLSGGILAFARALGEFGATLMVASNIPGKTQTLPIAIYDAVQSGNQSEANLLALGLTLTAIILILAFRRLGTTIVGGRAHE